MVRVMTKRRGHGHGHGHKNKRTMRRRHSHSAHLMRSRRHRHRRSGVSKRRMRQGGRKIPKIKPEDVMDAIDLFNGINTGIKKGKSAAAAAADEKRRKLLLLQRRPVGMFVAADAADAADAAIPSRLLPHGAMTGLPFGRQGHMTAVPSSLSMFSSQPRSHAAATAATAAAAATDAAAAATDAAAAADAAAVTLLTDRHQSASLKALIAEAKRSASGASGASGAMGGRRKRLARTHKPSMSGGLAGNIGAATADVREGFKFTASQSGRF